MQQQQQQQKAMGDAGGGRGGVVYEVDGVREEGYDEVNNHHEHHAHHHEHHAHANPQRCMPIDLREYRIVSL